MDLNIALGTLVYVLVFLVPGLLFRRFYFSGQFSKQFYHGNLLERFLWMLFNGIGVMSLCVMIIVFVRNTLSADFLKSVSYKTVYNLHSLLVADKIPEEAEILGIYDELFLFMSFVYAFSGLLGFVFYYAVVSLNLDKGVFSVLKFHNRWYYILKGKLYSPKHIRKNFRRIRTEVDVLVNYPPETKLYSGVVRDYFIDSKTNKLESLVLSKPSRWENKEGEMKKKSIPGDSFIIKGDNIINVNFHYDGFLGVSTFRNSVFDTTASVLFIVLLPSLVVVEYLFFDSFYLNSWFRRIVFFIFSILLFISLVSILEQMIKKLPKKEKLSNRGLLGFFLFTASPIGLLFLKLSVWGVLATVVLMLMIFPFISAEIKKSL